VDDADERFTLTMKEGVHRLMTNDEC
jgi:hypothetical protein